jgi:hypothetical protein
VNIAAQQPGEDLSGGRIVGGDRGAVGQGDARRPLIPVPGKGQQPAPEPGALGGGDVAGAALDHGDCAVALEAGLSEALT